MGWFTAKDAPSDEPVRGKTISDKDWWSLQSRVVATRVSEREQREGAKRGAANYRNRHRN